MFTKKEALCPMLDRPSRGRDPKFRRIPLNYFTPLLSSWFLTAAWFVMNFYSNYSLQINMLTNAWLKFLC